MKLLSTLAVLAVASGALLERDDRQLRQILSRAPHLANSGTELHEIVDWLNHRCGGCLSVQMLREAKAALTKEIRVVQKQHEQQWKEEEHVQEEQLTQEEQDLAEKLEKRARDRAQEELIRKEDLRSKAEEEAKALWQRQQELLWQQQEETKAKKLEEQEKKEQETREAELAKLRKEKLAQKLSLYDKEAHAQWVEIEAKEEARKAKKEREAEEQAEAELNAVRQQKLAQKRRRQTLAEKAAALEAERQVFLGKFWPALRPVVATFFREIRVDSLDDAMTGAPLIRMADGR